VARQNVLRTLDRFLSLAVAVCLAFLVWLYARSRDQETLDNVPVPVAVSLAPRDAELFALEVNGPSQVNVSFTGPPSRLRELRAMLRRGEMTVPVILPLRPASPEEGRYLDTVRVIAEDIHPPAGVRAMIAEGTNRIPVTVRRLVERTVPVRLDHGLGDRLGGCVIEPAAVRVRGPQEVLDRVQAIPTRRLSLPAHLPTGATHDVVARASVGLVDEWEGCPVRVEPASVNVRVTLRPQRRLYDVRVPVHFLCPANFPLRPVWLHGGDRAGWVALKLEGPAAEEPPAVRAFVDLTGRAFNPGRDCTQLLYADEPVQLQLPKEFQLAQPPPRSDSFKLVPLPADRPGSALLGGTPPP
jgi:hypothetical protein